MSLRTKMFAASAAIASMLALSGLWIHSLWSQSELAADSARQLVMLDALGHEFESIGHGLFSTAQDGVERQLADTATNFERGLDRLESDLKEIGIEAGKISAMRSNASTFVELAGRVVALHRRIGLDDSQGLRGALRTAVNDVEDAVRATDSPAALAAVLQLRLGEKDFMLRFAEDDIARFTQHLESARAALDPSQHARLDVYAATFRAYADARKSLGLTAADGLLGKLHDASGELDQTITAMDKSLATHLDDAGRGSRTMMVFGLVAVVLVVIAANLWNGMSITRRICVVNRQLSDVAKGEGDLSQRLDVQGKDEIATLAVSFNQFVATIDGALRSTSLGVASLGTTGDQLSSAATATRHGMDGLQQNTHAVVVAIEELSATSKDVASNAAAVSDSARRADEEARDGQALVHKSMQATGRLADDMAQAADAIRELRQESENIGSILDVIRGIADQTNLLALNAAIEAARAGEQGRGFAVVADEVRTLAQRSQHSTEEIQTLIERLQTKSEQAVEMAERGQSQVVDSVEEATRANESLTHITESVGNIMSMTLQIATAAEEQSSVAEDITRNVASIDRLAKNILSHSDQTFDISAKISEVLAAVLREMSKFRFSNGEALVLAQARSAHLAWKSRLRAYLDGHAHLSEEQAVSHTQCDLGKWYYGSGIQDFGSMPEFKALEPPHEEIHKLIREVITLRSKGETHRAEQLYQRVVDLSEQIIHKIDDLEQRVTHGASAA